MAVPLFLNPGVQLWSATKSDDLYCKFDKGPCAANKRFGLGGSDECDAVLHIAFG
jgi:hypothetical protein